MFIDYLSKLTETPIPILESNFEKQMQILIIEGYEEMEAFKLLSLDLIKNF
jgi:hypothetical protein